MRLMVTSTRGAVTEWFRRPEAWPLILNYLRTSPNVPHIYAGGVASGEEAYSLAMLLEYHRIPGRITATDIDPELIHYAKAGTYPRSTVHQAAQAGMLSSHAITRFLRSRGDRCTVSESVRSRVTFSVADLRTEELPNADMFLLRNLWRHLGDDGAHHLARQVAQALPTGGILSIGGADVLTERNTMSGISAVLGATSLRPVGIADIYHKT
ncbi:MAG: hypothetical protein CVT61_00250 [Actinobacteria bacterium HGW-Actinobacteria-11]|nr:MAG: hypothetical protein CVT61_00250 [Actinobacteria bacterium HGW-Actinobacteria-11]